MARASRLDGTMCPLSTTPQCAWSHLHRQSVLLRQTRRRLPQIVADLLQTPTSTFFQNIQRNGPSTFPERSAAIH